MCISRLSKRLSICGQSYLDCSTDVCGCTAARLYRACSRVQGGALNVSSQEIKRADGVCRRRSEVGENDRQRI